MKWRLDYSFALEENIGENGLSSKELDEIKKRAGEVFVSILLGREKGEPFFLELPYYRDLSDRCAKWATNARDEFDTFVLLGIGGSALGPRAIIDSLRHPLQAVPGNASGGMRILVCDNVDPRSISAILDTVDLSHTVFNVISKSGGTAEVLSMFSICRHRLIDRFGQDGYRKRIIFTTDPEKGPLRKIARDEDITAFEVPPNVGGRYSVLTPVGFLPAAAAGVNLDDMLSGAEKIDHACRTGDILDNPSALFAAISWAFHAKKNRNILVTMPYHNGLLTMAEWFQQLWAESLGKEFDTSGAKVNAGSTPVRALGATDQHSQLQLYMEGPQDKTVCFMRVEKHSPDVVVPESYPGMEDLGYLGGKTLGELINAEQEASAAALASQGRPNFTLSLDSVNAETIGGLFYFFELATAIGGGLYKVNPYDQPGVELGKKLTYGMMGRKGFERKDTRPKVSKAVSFPK